MSWKATMLILATVISVNVAQAITAAVSEALTLSDVARALKAAGIDRLIATDSIAGPGRRLPVAGALARAWREMDAA